MKTLFIISQIIFVLYVSFIWIKYGAQKSISNSYYSLPRNYRFLFTLFCWGFALPCAIIGVEATPLMFFAGAGICFVGAAAEINYDFVKRVHVPAAIIGVVLSQIAIVFTFNMWYLTLTTAVLTLISYLVFRKYWIWLGEICAFVSISIALGAYLY